MQSTPAVFCTPAADVLSSPALAAATPPEQAAYPWAIPTPEASPIFPSLAPQMFEASIPAVDPPVCRKLLRSMCEPVFEQMLDTLQVALQEQRIHPAQIPATMHMMMESMLPAICASHQMQFPAPPMPMYQSCQPCRMFDEASTEAEESGAFSALLSGSSSPSAVEVTLEPPFPSMYDDSDQASDGEKTVMVCRHWRSKGWCRLEDKCKFLHPENKRGIAAPSDVPLADGEVAAAVSKRKKRGGKGRSKPQQGMEQAGFMQMSTLA